MNAVRRDGNFAEGGETKYVGEYLSRKFYANVSFIMFAAKGVKFIVNEEGELLKSCDRKPRTLSLLNSFIGDGTTNRSNNQ